MKAKRSLDPFSDGRSAVIASAIERQVSVMFSIAKIQVLTVKAILTKLWLNLFAGRTAKSAVSVPHQPSQHVRNVPEEGATRKARVSGMTMPVMRQPETGRMKSVSSSSVSSTLSETRMTNVIRLQDRTGKGGRRPAQDASRTDATILLFTGIRYERIDGKTVAKTGDATPANGTTKTH